MIQKLLFIAILLVGFTTVTNCQKGKKNCCKKVDERLDEMDEKLDEVIALVKNLSCGSQGPASSCREIFQNGQAQGDKAYMLQMDVGKIPVYCQMTSDGVGACGGGGWTLAMKTDGNQETFHYDSHFWSDKLTYNIPGGETGFDAQQTKLPTYWNTPFSKICLGMKVNGELRFIVINQGAASLYQLIADGSYRATTLGRDAWKILIGTQASLQTNCNREGFNTASDSAQWSKARIGILGNNENDCNTCDSRIGFGTGGLHDDSNTCGNEATGSPDNGDQHIKAMGYILVQ